MLRILAAIALLCALQPHEPTRPIDTSIIDVSGTETMLDVSTLMERPKPPGSAIATPSPATTLALARVLVSETGFVRGPDDAAIFAVLEHRAMRMRVPLLQAMRRYSGRVFDRHRTDHRRWVAHLHGDERPRGWPRGTRWRPEAWRDAVRTAEALLRGELKHSCNSPVIEHWGARSLRREQDGWSRIDCGPDALNLFWRLPHRAQ